MEFIFNPINDKYPAGACTAGTSIKYTLKVSRFVSCTSVFFVLIDDKDGSTRKVKMPLACCDAKYFTYKATLNFPTDGLYWYHFEIKNDSSSFYLCKNHLFDVEACSSVTNSFAQVVYKGNSRVDKDFHKGIIYHIFVDRFKKSGKVECKKDMTLRRDWGGSITKNSKDFLVLNRECYGGNLQGIVDKLPYIKSLGTKTIFLSPIFESNSYHKYDTVDYESVDSMFGGDAALELLIKEAGKLGIKILLDGVFNHVGSDSIYFKDALQGEKSKYYDWFSFDKFPDKYSCWWGIDTLPQFNENNESLQKFIAGPSGVVAKWMNKGILGFRLDVADEITDPLLNPICTRIKKVKSDALILGEVWEDAATKIAYGKRRAYFSGGQLDSVMNYPLRNAIIDFVSHGYAEGLAGTFYLFKDHYPAMVQNNLMNFLGSHDTKRILNILGETGKIDVMALLKISSVIQYCAPGVPAVFYGDEVGVTADSATGGDAPFCRVCYPWGMENKEILAWYKKLGKLRENELFAQSDCNVILAHNGVFIFERTDGNKRIVIAVNCGHDDFKLNLRKPMKDWESGKNVKNSVLLNPYQFAILQS